MRKRSIRTRVHYSLHALVGSWAHLEGVLSKIYPFCKGTGFFIVSRRQIPPFYAITQNPKNRLILDTFGTILDTIILPFSRRGFIILKAKSGHSTNQNNAKTIKSDAQSVKYIFCGSQRRAKQKEQNEQNLVYCYCTPYRVH